MLLVGFAGGVHTRAALTTVVERAQRHVTAVAGLAKGSVVA
jgi:hypothetical protein